VIAKAILVFLIPQICGTVFASSANSHHLDRLQKRMANEIFSLIIAFQRWFIGSCKYCRGFGFQLTF
jgi:hypothetical protein